MTFRDWLLQQTEDEGVIGHLALLVHDDASAPTESQPTLRKEHDMWAVYTYERLGSPGPFLIAWKAWKASR